MSFGLQLNSSLQSSSESPSRRWNKLEVGEQIPGPFDDRYALWTNKKITYCFDLSIPTDEKAKLKGTIESAWQLWETRGMGDMRMDEGDATFCGDSNNQRNYLMIQIPSSGGVSTTVGQQSRNYMRLKSYATLQTYASQNPVQIVAHEIGHAWGLFHEHQRKNLWAEDHGGTAPSNYFTWNCQNLADYSYLLGRLDPAKMGILCRKQSEAALYQFSASNFLPDKASIYGGDFDSASIMMYASDAGGISGANGKATVFTGPGGTTYGYNMAPSLEDARNLRAMYEQGDTSGKATFKALFKSAKSSMFKKVALGRQGSGSTC